MCGICGIWDRQRRLRPVAAMNQAQRHRGPDDEGFFFVSSTTGACQAASGVDSAAALGVPRWDAVDTDQYDLVLGSRRLAILDLSPAGHMPMASGDSALWLVYNGEIYNYRELRAELMQRGHRFVSGADTEVILAAYAEWGVECLARFNGMFAFALWDGRRRRLFCARDRFGVKPFYFYRDGDLFVFASEIKALLQHPATPRRTNDRMIYDYLALGASDHTEQSFFEEIQSLPPGHFLLVDAASHEFRVQRWWSAQINPAVAQPGGGHDPQVYAQFAALLEDAIRLRLRSDVPVGSCLSGGLDSSAVVCLANRLLRSEQVIPANLVGDHQKTFTARNAEIEIDEHRYSRLVVDQTGAEENLVLPSGEQLWQEIESFVWHLDEPVNSTSQYPQWTVMRLARQRGVTVLLDGQGGDEILAGYHAYFQPYLSQLRQQQGTLAALRGAWDIAHVGGTVAVDALFAQGSQHLPWRVRQVLEAVRPPRPAPGNGGSGLQDWQLAPAFMQRFVDRQWRPAGAVDEDGLVGVLLRDLTSTNLPKLLRYEDRNSMAFSIESRLPFLDYRLVEQVFALPLNYRIHRGWTKWILRKALSDVLPPEICWRRSKLGFPTPEENWLRQGSPFVRDLLQRQDRAWLSTYVRLESIDQMVRLPDAELAATPGLWRLVNFVLWHELYFRRRL